MEKERRVKTLSLVALIVAVLGLTVAFAALSQTLTINGTASVNAAEWDIHFENLVKEKFGDASINGEPVINGTSINDIDVTLTKPEDNVIYGFDIANNGTIDAKISSIDISPLCTLQSSVELCDWNNDGTVTQEDIDKVNNNISIFLVYQDEKINNGSPTEIKVNDILKAGDTNFATFIITYSKVNINGTDFVEEEATEVPERNLLFNNLNVTIKYVQAD